MSPKKKVVGKKLKKLGPKLNLKKAAKHTKAAKYVKAKKVMKQVKKPTRKTTTRRKPKMRISDAIKMFPVVSIFGHRVNPKRVRDAAVEVYRKRKLTTDDIHMDEFIGDKNYDNLMVKIAILDHIEEQATVIYPEEDIIRTNRLTLRIAK